MKDKEDLKIKLLKSINNQLKSRNQTSMIEGQMFMKLCKHVKKMDSLLQNIVKFKDILNGISRGLTDIGNYIYHIKHTQSHTDKQLSDTSKSLKNVNNSLELMGGIISHSPKFNQSSQSNNAGQNGTTTNEVSVLSEISDKLDTLDNDIMDIPTNTYNDDDSDSDDDFDDDNDYSDDLDNISSTLNDISGKLDNSNSKLDDIATQINYHD